MAEKADIERATAEEFLRVYNAYSRTNFTIIEHSDSPDFRCRDTSTGESLNLEVTNLEDLHGDIQYLVGRGSRQGARSFSQDTLARFRERITDKCMSDYGPSAALVLRQVVPLWTTQDWEMYRDDFQAHIPADCKATFKKGIWVLTWRDSAVLSERDIVLLTAS